MFLDNFPMSTSHLPLGRRSPDCNQCVTPEKPLFFCKVLQFRIALNLYLQLSPELFLFLQFFFGTNLVNILDAESTRAYR